MIVWVLDLDGVLQEPVYPHPSLLADISPVIGKSYDRLYAHYSMQFVSNEVEEDYHLSLCKNDKQREAVRAFWRKLHDNMMRVSIKPGAAELLVEISARGEPIFAWTKGEGTEGVQRRRLTSIGLSQFFRSGHIISSPRKGTVEGLEKDLLPKLPDGKKILVGDLFRQDIEPALSMEDFTCVWVRWPDSNELVSEISEGDYTNLRIVGSTRGLLELVKKGALDD